MIKYLLHYTHKACQTHCAVTHTRVTCAHRCLCLCRGPGGGRGAGRRQRSSSPAVCAWKRRPAWGRCSGAGDGTRAAPSPSQPAHRLRPSWSACSLGRCAARWKDTCVNQTVRLLWRQMEKINKIKRARLLG